LNVSNAVIEAFKVVDKSLVNSSASINNATGTLYKSLESKLTDPNSAEKARYWKPKADSAKILSDEINQYIDNLKLELKQAANLKSVDGKEQFREDNLDASTRLFETNGKGKELEANLKAYREAILHLDPAIKKEFQTSLPIDMTIPITKEGSNKTFTTAFFHMTPTVAALTMLSKFQNNVKNSENQVVTFAHNQIGAVKVIYDQFAALVGQSSNYVMPGQEIEITAGVGAYSKAAQPQISINGAGQSIDADGRAVYKFLASGAGNHSVPVIVTYTKPDGTKETKTIPVEYTVGTPGGAAVMLDKMNVFYIGVPNQVTISFGTGWDITHVSMSGGTLKQTGGPGKYEVRVSEGTKASITVNADGKASTYDFRIKSIPDPIIKVGPSSGGRIQSVIFKNQQFVRADLEHFDFEARFSVVSATVYFGGANFANVQQATITGGNLGGLAAQLSKCIPGTLVIFDNVKVQGPDGRLRTIQNPPGFSLW